MIFRLLLCASIWNLSVHSQIFHIEDIPIENYEHQDHKNDEIDVELMPRAARFLSLLKNERKDYHDIGEDFKDITTPDAKSRSKRNSEDTIKVIESLGKPLELLEIDIENITESSNESTTLPSTTISEKINDYIRFKRSSKENDQKKVFSNIPNSGKFIQANPQGSIGHYEKPVDDLDKIKDNTRETRGVTKDQWVKQPFPVQREETAYDDSVQFSSDTLRAPRVHFVTNGIEQKDPLEYKFDRQSRSRSLNRYSPTDLSAEMDYYQPRFARNYVPRERPYDRPPNVPRDNYRQNYPDYTRNLSPDYNPNRKRRIIYYATLPDISRNSRNDDYRPPFDRYIYRDRYEDRYPYQDRYVDYRRYDEPRYEDDRPREPAYPVKVSTDVKVRGLKKNPERRIYSDVDRTRHN
ncbi:uncharacterized protein LOC130445012 [Diorhabda sublineata]|uniref:uncharacterized protein LOC130445012 n=1 Tax=Diorhabda sublineata TaxID=1163346 RepID=UPI0024E193D3|nr:uncharacterized protein LOC130445012 [Diorhabda sublineata]